MRLYALQCRVAVPPDEIIIRQVLAERFRQGCAISDTARRVVAYRILQENPGITPGEANRLTLQRSYSQ